MSDEWSSSIEESQVPRTSYWSSDEDTKKQKSRRDDDNEHEQTLKKRNRDANRKERDNKTLNKRKKDADMKQRDDFTESLELDNDDYDENTKMAADRKERDNETLKKRSRDANMKQLDDFTETLEQDNDDSDENTKMAEQYHYDDTNTSRSERGRHKHNAQIENEDEIEQPISKMAKIGNDNGSIHSNNKKSSYVESSEIAFDKTKFKSEFSNVKIPKCMLCDTVYDVEEYSDSSPVMSMACYHTLCKMCVISSINGRRKKLKRNNINSTPCPVVTCKAPNAFRNEHFNWNEEFIKLCREMNCSIK